MTRNQRRAQFRRTGQQSETRIVPVQTSRKIHRSDIPALMTGPQTRQRKPHKPWKHDGISPYYWNFTTIDNRWDK